jgi:hypothetical protein
MDLHLIFMLSFTLIVLETTRLIVSKCKCCFNVSLSVHIWVKFLRGENLFLKSCIRTIMLFEVLFNLLDFLSSIIWDEFLRIIILTFWLGRADLSNSSNIHSIYAQGLNLIHSPSSFSFLSFRKDFIKVSFLLGSRSHSRLSFWFSSNQEFSLANLSCRNDRKC